MKIKQLLIIFLIALLVILSLTSCKKNSNAMTDGYYTAKMAGYDNHGWQEFITICVQGGEIVRVEYNAENESGFIKAWDMNYMRTMNSIVGTYPNRYTRAYAKMLLEEQDPDSVDVVSGATASYNKFGKLSKAVIDKAMNGDMTVAIVEYE